MKRIFITGASSGIGLATAKLLAERGDEVWGTSRDIGRIPQLPRLHAVRLDLGDNVSLGESFKMALREAGHFDVVINNAGSGHFGPAELLSAEAVHAQFQTLVFAHIELCRLALASIRARGAGRAWRVVDRNMKAAPKPDLVARNIAKLIDAANPPPRVTVGDAFQSIVAPFIFRFLPQPVRIWGLRKYYRL